MTKKQAKANDQRIARVYTQRCHGVQISIMDIGKVYAVGAQAIAEGADDTTLGDRMAAFANTIRHN